MRPMGSCLPLWAVGRSSNPWWILFPRDVYGHASIRNPAASFLSMEQPANPSSIFSLGGLCVVGLLQRQLFQMENFQWVELSGGADILWVWSTSRCGTILDLWITQGSEWMKIQLSLRHFWAFFQRVPWRRTRELPNLSVHKQNSRPGWTGLDQPGTVERSLPMAGFGVSWSLRSLPAQTTPGFHKCSGICIYGILEYRCLTPARSDSVFCAVPSAFLNLQIQN